MTLAAGVATGIAVRYRTIVSRRRTKGNKLTVLAYRNDILNRIKRSRVTRRRERLSCGRIRRRGETDAGNIV